MSQVQELLGVAASLAVLAPEELNYVRGYVAGVADGARTAAAGPAAATADRGSFPGKMGVLGDLNGAEKVNDLASKRGSRGAAAVREGAKK